MAAKLTSNEYGTVHYPDTSIRPRVRGGTPPERRPAAAICEQVARNLAERVRLLGASAVDLAARHSPGNRVLHGKAVELGNELYTLAYNIQFSGANLEASADEARRRFSKFRRLCH